jgi:TonB family protein
VKDENAGLFIGLAVMLLGVVLIGAPMLLGHQPLQSSEPDSATKGRSIASSSWGNAAHHLAGGGQASASLITANNTAVGLISHGKNEDAIELLEPLVKTSPDYGLGRDNLAIAYNNVALKQTDSPKVALDSLWRSFCLSAHEAKTTENIDAMLKVLHKQPNKFEDRVAMGDAQVTEGCLYGAYEEYTAALAIHDDAKVKDKLDQIKKQAANCTDDDINGAFFVKVAMRPAGFSKQSSDQATATDAVDFAPYMARLQKSIKRNWFPPKKESSQKTQVTFSLARDGTISNLRVTQSSGDQDEDQAGLRAVQKLGKAEPLPLGADAKVDIQFSFDYNVFNSAKDE